MKLPKHLARRLPLACGLALAVVVVMTLIAPQILAESSDSVLPEAELEKEDVNCTDSIVKEHCLTIEWGGLIWRYAYYPGTSDSAETVIFDPGGPGTSVLAGQFSLDQLRLELGDRYHLIVVEEPWVTADIPESCGTAASSYYRALRQSLNHSSQEASDLATACSLSSQQFGFTAESYGGVIEAIATLHSLNPVGFLGHSFASVRLAYLTDTNVGESLEWAVIARPFPVGAEAQEMIDARSIAIRDNLGEFEFTIEPFEIGTRSLPVTVFDYWSAVIGIGYVADENLQLATDALFTSMDPATIGALSDQLWMRYGVDSISPGMFAQMQEICGAFGMLQLADLQPRLDESPEGILAAQLLPCVSFETPQADLKLQDNLPICISISEQDLVTPSSLARTYFEGYEMVTSGSRSHGSNDGWLECHNKLNGYE